jgi:hypothetical protein
MTRKIVKRIPYKFFAPKTHTRVRTYVRTHARTHAHTHTHTHTHTRTHTNTAHFFSSRLPQILVSGARDLVGVVQDGCACRVQGENRAVCASVCRVQPAGFDGAFQLPAGQPPRGPQSCHSEAVRAACQSASSFVRFEACGVWRVRT